MVVLVTTAVSEKEIAAYLKHQLGKHPAKRFLLRQVDDQMDTDEPSYDKKHQEKNFRSTRHLKYLSATAALNINRLQSVRNINEANNLI